MYKSGRKEGNVLFNDAFNYFNTVIWHRTWWRIIQILREKTCCCHYMDYSFRLAARVLLYAPSYRQDSTYHSLCYTSRVALAGIRNSSIGPSWWINPTIHCTMSECSYHWATSFSSVLIKSRTKVILTTQTMENSLLRLLFWMCDIYTTLTLETRLLPTINWLHCNCYETIQIVIKYKVKIIFDLIWINRDNSLVNCV